MGSSPVRVTKINQSTEGGLIYFAYFPRDSKGAVVNDVPGARAASALSAAFRYVLRAGILVYVPDVMDGSADSVKQRCAAAGEIFLLRHGRNFAERQTVVDDCAFIVEEHGGDERLAGFFLLLCDHGVEAADGVRLQS